MDGEKINPIMCPNYVMKDKLGWFVWLVHLYSQQDTPLYNNIAGTFPSESIIIMFFKVKQAKQIDPYGIIIDPWLLAHWFSKMKMAFFFWELQLKVKWGK